METVGQFDHDNAQVFDHGHHHFAYILGLGLGTRLAVKLGQLADTVHQLGDFLAKFCGQLFTGDDSVFNDIVE